ncbi:MAG: acyl-CoA dehydrogenase family protein [Flavobacteriales bacterium]|nr:acyl-CoA dehydrogenase family protein [Flavobacteriales bacterium]
MTEFIERPIFSEEHSMFRQSVRDFIAQEITPHNAEWEKNHMVSRESWEKLGANGFLCMQVPEEYGGLGIDDFRYNAIFTEELSRSGAAGPAVGYPLHSDIVLPYILDFGPEEMKKKWGAKMMSGEAIGAIAMTEPGAGSDLQGMKCTAEDKGDHYLVNGSKTFITNGYLCDVCVTAVKTDPFMGAKGISMLLLEADMEGFTKGEPFDKVGLHAQDTCELFFDNVKVPKENLIGEEGAGFKYLMTELAQERLVVGIGAIGAAEGIFWKTADYLKERKAFGHTISQFQNSRFKMAEMATEITKCRALLDQCLALHNDGKLDAAMASMVKLACTEVQYQVADECLQQHGGYGYMWEYDVARAWADARVQRIYAGTNEIMKELIARKFVGK